MKPYKLGETFSPGGLRADLIRCDEFAWGKRNTTGWTCLSLRSRAGRMEDVTPGYNTNEPFKDTPLLEKCPHFKRVLDTLERTYVINSVRVSVLEPGGTIGKHRDDREPWRIHVPVQTNDQATLTIGESTYCWQPGEAWFADFNQVHSARNAGVERRVHLLFIVGGGGLPRRTWAALDDDGGMTLG